MRFDKDDLEDEYQIQYDLIIFGITIDSMALFNLLDKPQANRIFKYINYGFFYKMKRRTISSMK